MPSKGEENKDYIEYCNNINCNKNYVFLSRLTNYQLFGYQERDERFDIGINVVDSEINLIRGHGVVSPEKYQISEVIGFLTDAH